MPQDIHTTSGKMRSIDKESPMVADSKDYGLPCFEVKVSDIPEAEDWDVGEEYNIELVVKQKAVRSKDNENWVEFQIKKIKAL